MTPHRAWLTVGEVAETLHSHPEVVRRWLRAGRLAGIKVGRGWRVPTDSLPEPLRAGAEAAPPVNLIEARIQRVDGAAGLTWLDTSGEPLGVIWTGAGAGTRVRVLLGSDAILVSRRRLSGISARNQWVGHVDSLLVRSDGVEVRVATRPPLVAWMTPAAVRDLRLRPGERVVLVFKAGGCRVVALPDDSGSSRRRGRGR